MRLHYFIFICPLYCWSQRRGNDNTRTL